MNTYDVGDLVRCSVSFKTADGAPRDPTVVKFEWKKPSANNHTEYTYGTDAELVKDGVGNYHVDLSATEAGGWLYRFYATGSGQCAGESYYNVRGSNF